jgi:hypothetical protein
MAAVPLLERPSGQPSSAADEGRCGPFVASTLPHAPHAYQPPGGARRPCLRAQRDTGADSYLGALLLFIGWMLLFRSLLAFFVLPIAIWIVVSRMNAEEALLASEFGDAYAAYRRRTWRLIPLIY